MRKLYFISSVIFLLIAIIKVVTTSDPLFYLSTFGLAVCFFALGLLEKKKNQIRFKN
ncbi:hypothetical protein [Alkalicoccobacillus plakortidis]|uniref:Uncharacterized protein n=1 Tax=Alkalicoccobacillus plakortidis TaxID=444060 RepID=A0ABT0XEE9_9BACI|nr:hypothetical protein [Alkalicoccobacillus plakortidis]MCM2674252.1 hypothetical protein [Alkalicoccobacillus plakortidis]